MTYLDLELLKSNYETKTMTELHMIFTTKPVSMIEILVYASALALPTIVLTTNGFSFFFMAD